MTWEWEWQTSFDVFVLRFFLYRVWGGFHLYVAARLQSGIECIWVRSVVLGYNSFIWWRSFLWLSVRTWCSKSVHCSPKQDVIVVQFNAVVRFAVHALWWVVNHHVSCASRKCLQWLEWVRLQEWICSSTWLYLGLERMLMNRQYKTGQ